MLATFQSCIQNCNSGNNIDVNSGSVKSTQYVVQDTYLKWSMIITVSTLCNNIYAMKFIEFLAT